MNTVNTREAVYSFKRTSRAKLCILSKEHQNHMQLLLEATSSRQQQATTGDPLFDSIVPSSQRRSTEIEPATADTHAMEIVLQDRKHNTKSLSTTSMQLLLQCCYGPRVLGATCNEGNKAQQADHQAVPCNSLSKARSCQPTSILDAQVLQTLQVCSDIQISRAGGNNRHTHMWCVAAQLLGSTKRLLLAQQGSAIGHAATYVPSAGLR